MSSYGIGDIAEAKEANDPTACPRNGGGLDGTTPPKPINGLGRYVQVMRDCFEREFRVWTRIIRRAHDAALPRLLT